MERGRAEHRGRRERGNVLVMTVGALIFCLSVAVLALDTGRIAWQKRQLRLQTDLAALAAARDVGDCRVPGSDPAAAAQASAAANGFQGSLAEAPNAVTLGRVTTVSGLRTFSAVGDPASARAVEVVAFHDVPRSWILPGFVSGSLPLRAAATARAQAIAAFSVGSWAVSFDQGLTDASNDVLGGFLGGLVDVSAIGYDGLLNARVGLGDLVAATAGVGTVDDLLSSELDVADFLTATADALQAGGDPTAAATLAGLAASVPSGQTFAVGDILSVAQGVESEALDASVGVLDLITASAQAANGEHALVVDPLSVNVPGVASSTLRLQVIEPPQIAIGPPGRDADGNWRTRATTSQVRLQIDLEALDDLTLPGLSASVSVSLYYEVARAEAHLDWIDCARAAAPAQRVGIGVEPGLLSYGVGTFVDIEDDGLVEPVVVVELTLLGSPIASVEASMEGEVASPAEDLAFDGPFPPAQTQSTGSTLGDAVGDVQNDVQQNTSFDVEVLGGLPLGVSPADVESATRAIVEPILADVSGQVTDLLLALNGHAGGADVTVFSVQQSGAELVR